jgi:hypothetical protein
MTSYVSVFTGDVIQPTDVSYKSFSISANLVLFWPQDGDAAGDYAARVMQISASTTSLSVYMPPANQTSVGTDSLVRNTGSNTFTVRDYAGNTIVAVAAGEAKYIYVTDNSTAAGTWGVIAFGVGSSSADAASLAGYGLKAITTTLNQSHPVATVTSTFTADATYRAKAIVWTGGVGTLNLTAAATLGDDWFMMIRNGGTGLLTIDPNSSELINGSASLALQIGDSAFICCSGTAFYTVGLGQETTFAYSQLTLPVTSGSTYTLTPAQAQNTIIKVTGTSINSNVTVVLPAAVQVYFALNQTSGTANVIFTTNVGGGTNSSLAASQQATLVCDSVNVLNATTVITGGSAISIIDGSAASPALNFTNETNTGMYRPTGGSAIGMSIGGTAKMLLTTDGLAGGAF